MVHEIAGDRNQWMELAAASTAESSSMSTRPDLIWFEKTEMVRLYCIIKQEAGNAYNTGFIEGHRICHQSKGHNATSY